MKSYKTCILYHNLSNSLSKITYLPVFLMYLYREMRRSYSRLNIRMLLFMPPFWLYSHKDTKQVGNWAVHTFLLILLRHFVTSIVFHTKINTILIYIYIYIHTSSHRDLISRLQPFLLLIDIFPCSRCEIAVY